MTTDEIRAEIDQIERGAMWDQPGWMAHLDRQSNQGREKHLQILLEPSIFEQWRVRKLMLSGL